VEQFPQSFGTCKIVVRVFLILQVFTPLYRGVKETLLIVSTSKRVIWNLIKSPMICCLIWLLSYEETISNPFHV